ncbi:MAG TPA: hypothetical protein VGS21_04450, partial [Acidimicrobiales bacterium]|nr:hypothetical protein [Acidimicrobiales bacterium]
MTAGRSVSRTEILLRRFAGLAVLAGAVVMPMSLAGASGSTTPPGVILGEGGSFAQPIIDALLKGSTKDISPEAGSYFLSNVDLGRDDFATGNADFAVTEFPLTSQQAGFAKTNGRAYAYVPFAAQSVALGAIVEREVDNVLKPTTLNKDIQLNDVQIADIYTNAATAWNSTQLAPPSGTPYTVNNASRQVSPRYLVDPALTTYDLEALILDNPAAKAIWSAWLKLQNIPVTPPSELWPTNQGVSGGDDILASNLVPLDETKRPPVAVSNPTAWGQGDIAPLP